MNKFEMVESIMNDLNGLRLSGVQNWQTAIEILSKLVTLRDGLKEDDLRHQEQIRNLDKQLASRPPVVFHEDGTVTIGGEEFPAETFDENQNGGEQA